MIDALDHVLLAVRDLDGARDTYRRLLGLEPSWNGEHPEAGTANCLFRLDNTYLELLSPVADGPIGDLLRAWMEQHGEGLLGLAFRTPDLDDCVAALRARGLEPGPIEPGHGRDLATGAERGWRRATLPPDRTRGVLMFPIEHQSPVDALPRARPAGPAPLADAAVHALDHVVVQTADGDAARALFGEQLGLRLALDKRFEDWGVRLQFFRTGGVTVEVASALSGASAVLPETDVDRLYGLSYRVRDIEAAQRRLASTGLDVSEVRRGRRPGTRVFTVRNGTLAIPTLVLALDESSS